MQNWLYRTQRLVLSFHKLFILEIDSYSSFLYILSFICVFFDKGLSGLDILGFIMNENDYSTYVNNLCLNNFT